MAGEAEGYVYQRDGHPNAFLLAETCRALHGAERAAITSTGMSALSAALLALLAPGDHVLVSRHLYGKTTHLITSEAARWGVTSTVVDFSNAAAAAQAITPRTRLLVAETIANPLLQVADIAVLADLAHQHGAKLLVDNTFATPTLCRPLELGADLVWESLTKMMNGHSDVVLGLLCGYERDWSRVPAVVSAWGLSASPFDCWLAQRGLATLHLRAERASSNALAAARFLAEHPAVAEVHYPGLPGHPQHDLATRQFGGRYGAMLTLRLQGGRPAADAFIRRAGERIPFCPSLGEVSTTLSHPQSTSHRGLPPDELAQLGIDGGTIRLSVGCESEAYVIESLRAALGESA